MLNVFVVLYPVDDILFIKGKGFPYSLTTVGPEDDHGVQAVSPQAVGCHYFPPGMRFPFQTQSITALWPVPSYTVW